MIEKNRDKADLWNLCYSLIPIRGKTDLILSVKVQWDCSLWVMGRVLIWVGA